MRLLLSAVKRAAHKRLQPALIVKLVRQACDAHHQIHILLSADHAADCHEVAQCFVLLAELTDVVVYKVAQA